MNNDSELLSTIFKAINQLSYAFFAAFGGVVFYLAAIMETNPTQTIRWRIVIVYGLCAGFVGQIAMLLCRSAGISYELTGAIVGLAGAIGGKASLSVINSMLKKRFGLGLYVRRSGDTANDNQEEN